MKSSRSPKLPPISEQIAAALWQAGQRRSSGRNESFRRLEERREKEERLMKAGGVEGIRARRDQSILELTAIEAEIEGLEQKLREAEEHYQRLDVQIDLTLKDLLHGCRQQIGRLPALDSIERTAWVEWLEEWHRHKRRSFEQADEWASYFTSREIDSSAMQVLAPVMIAIDQLELDSETDGIRGVDLHAELERRMAEVKALEEENRSRVEARRARFGRILEDLPDPSGVSEPSLLAAYEMLLRYLEGVLGQFAASARLEAVTLEVLS